jgi:hypothetical protein
METRKRSIDERVADVEAIVGTWPESRRKPVARLLTKIGIAFFTAPASAREEYHSCYPGGLADHSLNVVENLLKIAGVYAPDYTREQLEFVGLFHDVGKSGNGEADLYVPNPSDWHRSKGMLYKYNDAIWHMPHSERSIYLLTQFGVPMNEEEFIAIRIHDGQYEESNKQFAMKEPRLAILLHWADVWSDRIEKGW